MATNNTCICEFLFKHSSTNEEVESSGSSNVLHLRKRTKRVADKSEKKAESQKKAQTEPVGNMMDIGDYHKEFLDLFEGACHRDEGLIDLGNVKNPDFWNKFVEFFNISIMSRRKDGDERVEFTAKDCQGYANSLYKLYKGRRKVLVPDWTRLSNIFGHSLPNLSVRNKSTFKTKTRSSKSGTNTGNSIGNSTGTSEGRITPEVFAYMPQCERLSYLQKTISELELDPCEEEKVTKYYQQSETLGPFLMQDKKQRARKARFIIQNGL